MKLAACATLAFAALASAQLDVTIQASATVRTLNGGAPSYAFFPGTSVLSDFFTDPLHQSNFVRLQSAHNMFASQTASPSLGGTYTGSVAFATATGLLEALQSASPWSLRVIDGATLAESNYLIEIDVSAITAEYLRVITVQSPLPGTSVVPNITTSFTVSSGVSAYTEAFGIWSGPTTTHIESFPVINSTWTPTMHLASDANTIEVQLQTFEEPGLASLISVTPLPGAAEVSEVRVGCGFWSNAKVTGLTVTACDSIDFNNDTSLFDPMDIDAFLSVYSEGPCIPETATCNDIDFNNDGSVFDPCDVDSFLVMFSEGPCTVCGV
ncbi:MAG: hypothetical protein U0640_04550 [Phycisphaerales bacterium]